MPSTNSYNLILQPRDQKLLAALDVLRLVDREQATMVAGFTSTTRANTRLLALTRAGLLERTFIGTAVGGRRAVYYLPGRRPKLSAAAFRDHAFAHQLAVNAIYLNLAHQPLPPHVRLIRWERFEAVLSQAVPLIPDGYARIQTGESDLPLFVEVDLGTEPQRIWEKKIRLYLELATSGEFNRLFGAASFRVLVIAPGFRRCLSIMRTIRAQTEKVFWLTTAEAVRRHGLWAPIWTRPNGRTRLPLISQPHPSPAPSARGGRAGPAPGTTAPGSQAPNAHP